ncbi:MAG: DUF4178 domain-containing protein [Firmicutes bacterium]|nr:DUF4178 domain-containing protein [Bacillota bacterium]
MEKMIKCPNCGYEHKVKDSAKAKTLFCSECNSFVDLVSNTSTQLYKNENMVVPPLSALRLGAIGNINGINYQIIGRIRYRDSFSFTCWDEWLLLSTTGQYLWLQEEDWEFVLMHKYTPANPFDPNAVGQDFVHIDGQKLEVEDNSQASLLFIEGELTWRAEPGETIKYIDAWKGEDTLYSCEWSEKEIMYFIGKDIPVKQIYAAFKLGTPPPEALEEDAPVGKRYDKFENSFQQWVSKKMKGPFFKYSLVLSALCAFFALFLLFFGIPIYSGNQTPVKDKEGYVIGPFNLTQVGRVHRVDTKVFLPNNTECYCDIEMLDSNKEEVLGWDKDYWHESGRDEDGYWEESDSNRVAYFVLKDPGEYYVSVTPENPSVDLSGSIVVSIKESVFHNGPLWTIAILAAIYPGFILIMYCLAHSKED